MAERAAPSTPTSGHPRCRCGHFPTHHMKVAPVEERRPGGFRLEPTGPCAVCGESACPRFAPT
ncbi:MAG: hypothetical protein L3K15_00910 [Thermoplasmata archaeon]|nr:hypothetical protein [Thermoplasmata archaeon]